MTATLRWICSCGHNRAVHQYGANPFRPEMTCKLCAVCGVDHRYSGGWRGHDHRSCKCDLER